MGTMGRLVRNLPGHAFPGWSTSTDRRAVASKLIPVIQELPGFKTGFSAEMPELSYRERRILMERKQLTSCMAARQDGCHFLLSRDQRLAVFVNEEEHLVMHSFFPGLSISQATELLLRRAAEIEEKLPLVASAKEGYLTSMPTECGEGIQLYTILHLPGMVQANFLPQISKALEKLHLGITAFYPELGDNAGNTFVIYTAAIRKGMLQEISKHLSHITNSLAEQELNTRQKLLKEEATKQIIYDQIARAYAVLRYAVRMEHKELLQLFSSLRWAIYNKIFTSSELEVEDLISSVLHLQLTLAPYQIIHTGNDPGPDPLLLRAALVKDFMSKAHIASTILV